MCLPARLWLSDKWGKRLPPTYFGHHCDTKVVRPHGPHPLHVGQVPTLLSPLCVLPLLSLTQSSLPTTPPSIFFPYCLLKHTLCLSTAFQDPTPFQIDLFIYIRSKWGSLGILRYSASQSGYLHIRSQVFCPHTPRMLVRRNNHSRYSYTRGELERDLEITVPWQFWNTARHLLAGSPKPEVEKVSWLGSIAAPSVWNHPVYFSSSLWALLFGFLAQPSETTFSFC